MAWLSFYQSVEAALIKLFLVLGLLCITPWAIWLAAELILFLFRWLVYEIPYVGGKARGKPRPRAPTLTEQVVGEKRPFSRVSVGEETEGHTSSTVQEEEERRPMKRQNTATIGG